MRWLHRLLGNGYQLFTQGVQVHLLMQRGAEGRHDLVRIISAAIEMPVNDTLDTMAQGLKERCNHQGRSDQDEERLCRL